MSDDRKQSTMTRGRISESHMDTKVRRPYRTVTPELRAKRAEASENFRGDPLMEQMEATLAALPLVESCGFPKEIASAAEVDASQGSRWSKGDASNPVNRVRQIIQRAKRPHAVAAYFLALVVKADLSRHPMPEWRWRSLTLEAIREEAHPDGSMDVAEAELLTGKSNIGALYKETAKHVCALLKLMALLQVGQIRGWSLSGPRIN